jgi:excisionase family DNA binding protein
MSTQVAEGADQLYTVEQFAERIKASPWTVRAHLSRGSLKPVRVGRLIRLSHAQLLEVLEHGLPPLRARPSAA